MQGNQQKSLADVDTIIVFNSGSSSLKFAIFAAKDCNILFRGEVDDIHHAPILKIKNSLQELIFKDNTISVGHKNALNAILKWYKMHINLPLIAIGHRIVHGGQKLIGPVKVTNTIINKMEKLIPLAPLHQPYNLEIIKIFKRIYPKIPQIACFDTDFHKTIIPEATLLPIPYKYSKEGIIRYGFHGLSYEYIASVLPKYLKNKSNGKIIVAHLGNGASMCAMKNKKSVATTMGFTSIGGLMMGTRCGDIDPGVILYLLTEKKMTIQEVTQFIYNESGLKGVSGISHDMRKLISSKKSQAKVAINLYCYQAASYLSGLISTLNGLDAIIFTAGIGANCPEIRQNICDRLKWLGININTKANKNNAIKISKDKSTIAVYAIPTNEEEILARKTFATLYI